MYFCIIVLHLLLCTQFDETSGDRWIESLKSKKEKFSLKMKPHDFKLIIPDFCMDSNICEHIPDYPQEFVDNVIKEINDTCIRLNEDTNYLEIRSDAVTESEQLCYSKRKAFVPRAARSKSQTWHLILSSHLYPQQFIGEVCSSDGNETSNCSSALFLMNSYGKCVQKYVQRKMVALNEDMDGVVILLVDIPSCCSCDMFRNNI